jgi:hypothetical protein
MFDSYTKRKSKGHRVQKLALTHSQKGDVISEYKGLPRACWCGQLPYSYSVIRVLKKVCKRLVH